MNTVQAYGRLGYAVLLAFGMIGNLARPAAMGPVIVMVLVCVVWVSVRISVEALEAYRYLVGGRETK